MDTLPAWFWAPASILLWVLVLLPYSVALLYAEPDPNPEFSRLDRLDGLDSRTG